MFKNGIPIDASNLENGSIIKKLSDIGNSHSLLMTKEVDDVGNAVVGDVNGSEVVGNAVVGSVVAMQQQMILTMIY